MVESNSLHTKIHEINSYFKIPLHYNEHKRTLKEHIATDLELVNTLDASCNPIYSFCFDNDNDVSKQINNQIVQTYTTDIDFLTDSQILLSEYKPLSVKYTDYSRNYKTILDIWNELKIDIGFKERYYFVEWEILEFLNRSEWFLQVLSVYNLMSPVLSLLVPIIILIIPFFLIKMKGIPITMNGYIDALKIVANQNAIGKLFVVNFSEINAQEKFYIFVSAAFYVFSIYQNFMVCARFNANMKTIHNHFNEIRIYIRHTIDAMENYLHYTHGLKSQFLFHEALRENMTTLQSMQSKIQHIADYNMFNISKIKDIGYVFKCFYEFHTDAVYDRAILYSLGFQGYLDCITGLQNNIACGKIQFCKFLKNRKRETLLENSYYAPLKDRQPVKNTVSLKKNMIVTGPNASGKTTVLKSTLINIIFSQQFGCGFYDQATLSPFHEIHCYLNIPDTSGRDSLFQAEARRCKEILDAIERSPTERHFCAFDELYSGTNPEEAEQSATAFMKYLTKQKQVTCMLTTHFIKVCKRLEKTKAIINCKMKTGFVENKLQYHYVLEKGISHVKGGILVLKQLNYPQEILDSSYEKSIRS